MRLDRTLMIAPHPDDESIGVGGLLQRVVTGGGTPLVVFITDGENNPWPQRRHFGRWSITDADRQEWSALRRAEARAALECLGVDPRQAVFLGFPDNRIMSLARRGDPSLRQELARLAGEFDPTLIVAPSARDLHADHRATSWFAHQAAGERSLVTYLVHGSAPAHRVAAVIELSAREQQRKREAIECHATQLRLSRARFLAYAGKFETYYQSELDLVKVEGALASGLNRLRHVASLFTRNRSGVEAAADVQHGPGDVAGLL